MLREHCAREGRDFDSIEKTVTMHLDPTVEIGAALEQFREMHDLGITAAYLMSPGPEPLDFVEVLGSRVIPEISAW